MKKILKWVGTGFAALLVVVIVGAWAMFDTFVKAANSIEKLEDGLYSMEFTGDYGFDEFLAANLKILCLAGVVSERRQAEFS